MTEKRFALRAVAGFAGIVMATSLATAPAYADNDAGSDRGRSEEAHQAAPGQERKEQAGNPSPGNGNGTPPSHAGGPAAQTPPPGQARPKGRPARPTHSSRPARPAKPAHPVHSAKPAKPAHPVGASKPANPHAKAGKTTICHATGSATNPYVTITISNNALPAHARHQDGRDLIPAPAGGCPQTAAAVDADGGKSDAGLHSAGARGKNGAPAPAAGGVLGFLESTAGATPAGGVLGVFAEGGAAPASLPPLRDTLADKASVSRRETGAAPAAGQLPFTGLEAALVALLGALLVLAGVLVRRLGGRPRSA